jgi:LysR family transcriptional regulator, hypochlorite-specific transcription factor HypT
MEYRRMGAANCVSAKGIDNERYDCMHTKWIEDFLALGSTLSFSRASEMRSITQPALSRRIQALEEWLDVELVDRSRHPFSLSRAGKLFYEKAPDILLSLEQLKNALHDDLPYTERFLKITASHSLASSFLPEWLHAMHQRVGNFNSRVSSTDVSAAITSLAANDADILLCYYHPQVPLLLDALQFDYLTLGKESMLPVSAPDGAGKPMFELPGRGGHPVHYLSYSDDTFMYRVVNVILSKNQQPCFLTPCYETAVSLLLRKMAQLGHGMTWLPESLVREDLVSARLVRAGAEGWCTDIEIRAYRAKESNNPLLQQIWSTLSCKKPSMHEL